MKLKAEVWVVRAKLLINFFKENIMKLSYPNELLMGLRSTAENCEFELFLSNPGI